MWLIESDDLLEITVTNCQNTDMRCNNLKYCLDLLGFSIQYSALQISNTEKHVKFIFCHEFEEINTI